MKLGSCPHCNKKIRYIQAWNLRKQSVYVCPHCREASSVILKRALYRWATNAILIGIAITSTSLWIVRKFTIIPILCVFIPFIFFYAISPFYVRLK